MGLWWLWDSHNDLPLDDLSQRLLDLAQSLDDPLKVALIKNQLAHWLVYSGQPEAGFAMHEEALAALQHHGERQHVALTLQFLGQAAAYAGDLRRALLYCDQAIALARTIGDLRTLAGSLMLRGYTTSPAFKEPVFSAPATLTACQRDLQEARRLDDEIER